jgi:muramidase (phage lysozyme)
MDIVDPWDQQQSTSESNPYVENYKSFLGKAEGADYNTIVGGKTFDDFSKHPGVIGATTKEGTSTAAGRYQITKSTYDNYASKLGINDFSPQSQDKIAEAIFKDKGAWDDISKGDYESANKKLGSTWASLPTSPYSQPKRSEEWTRQNLIMDPWDKKDSPQAKTDSKEIIDPWDNKAPTDSKGIVDPWDTAKPTSEDPYRKMGATETFAEHTIFGIPVSAGGYAGMVAGASLGEEAGLALAPVTAGVSTVAGPIIGGALGMFGAAYGTDRVLRAAGPESLNKLLDEGSQQHPYAAFAGDIASNFPVMGVGLPKTIVTESGKTISAGKQAALLITGGAGIEAGREYATGEQIDPAKIAISALTMPLFAGEPTALGKAVTFDKLRNLESTESLDDLLKKVTGTQYEDVVNKHIEEQRKLETFDQFKEKRLQTNYQLHIDSLPEDAVKPTFEQWSKRPDKTGAYSDEALKSKYEDEIRNRSLDHIYTNYPELARPDVNTAKLPANTNDFRNFFYNFMGAKTQDSIIGGQVWKLAEKDGLTAEMKENIRKHVEDGYELTPKEQELYSKYIEKPLNTARAHEQYLMDNGIIPKEKMDKNFFFRELMPFSKEDLKMMREQGHMEEEPSWWESIREKLVGRDYGAQDISRVQSAGQRRAFFNLEDKEGNKRIVQITKDGKLIEWHLEDKIGPEGTLISEKKVRFLSNDIDELTKGGPLKVGDKLFGGTLKQAAVDDIERLSPYKYNKDSLAVVLKKLNETREMVRAHQMLKELKTTDYFKSSAHKEAPGVPRPEGFVLPKGLDRLPELQGYSFAPRTAWILEDFAKQRNPTLLTEMSGMLVKNMMLNPLPHIFNEAWHLYNARGLSGWVTPAGIARFAKGMPEALKSVINQDEFYRSTLEHNGSLLAPSTRVNPFEDAIHAKALNEFAQGGGLKELARFFGRSVLDMYDGISKASSKAMWIVRDTMYLQYVKELMNTKGLTQEAAIKEAERHLPNYRLPETIGDKVIGERTGRLLSETLQNPNISVFSRYHYGMIKSILETMKDLGAIHKGAEGMEEFKQGVDTMAAVLVATAALYPLMDMVAQKLTGNPDAKQRRAGPYHLGHAIAEVADGTKDPQAVLSAVFTFNPFLLALAQLGLDRNLYNGQHIYDPMSAPDVIAADVGKYMLQQMPQGSQALRAVQDPGGKEEGMKTWEARQADIESPSAAKEGRMKMLIAKLKAKAIIHDAKERMKGYL